MYMFICIYVYIYIYVYVYIYIYVYVHIYAYNMYIYIYIYICICIYKTYMYICVYLHIFIFLQMCVNVYVHKICIYMCTNVNSYDFSTNKSFSSYDVISCYSYVMHLEQAFAMDSAHMSKETYITYISHKYKHISLLLWNVPGAGVGILPC